MSNEFKSKEEIIEDIKKSRDYFLAQAEELQTMLDALKIDSITSLKKESISVAHLLNGEPVKRKYTKKWHKVKQKFGNVIVNILTEMGKPMLTRTLMEEFASRTGKEYDRKNFSSRLSIEARNKKKIQNVHFENNPNDSKYWWGLKEWFANEKELKKEYFEKMKGEIVV